MDSDQMQALVAATQGRIKRAWLALVVHLREENPVAQIEARLHSGAVLGVRQASGLFAAEHVNAYINAGRQTARWVATAIKSPHLVRKALPIFDPADPPAARFAAQNRLDLIQEIDEQTRSMIHDVLLEGARSGANPKDLAREIRDSIGLTDHQTKIVANYRRQLEDGQYAAALRRELSSGNSDRVIASAMRSNKALSKAQIDSAVDRYRTNMIARRADDIARTEGLRVAHQGSEELYRQAVERGDLQAEQIERTWNHHPGRKSSKNDRTFHKVMHGQVRGYGEKFVSGLGAELRYPGDLEASGEETISCACALSTRLKPATGAASTGRPGLGGGAAEEGEATSEPAEIETEVIDEEAMDEEIADEEDAAEEEPVDAEEQAAEEADAEGAAEEGEATDLEPGDDLSPEDLADLLGEPAFDFPSNPEFTPEQRRHQQLQQQLQRLRDQKDAVKQAEADLADAKTTHAQLQADLRALIDSTPEEDLPAGFRIGVSSEITAEGDAATIELPEPPRPVVPEEVPTPERLPDDPYRTQADRDAELVRSDKPAPVGYESWEYDGQTYYHRVIGEGPYYTASQLEAVQAGEGLIGSEEILVGPNEQFPGFDTIRAGGETKFRPQETADGTYHVYTRDQVLSGEAVADEKWLAESVKRAAKKPSLFARLKLAILGPD